jgi:hypothetical protein
MELKQGDRVCTEAGEMGKIVFIDRLTAFVSFNTPDKQHDIRAFLLSTLKLINPASPDCGEPTSPD